MDELRQIAAGDADSFARWLSRAEPRLRASLRSLAAHVDAEAVMQEALLRVWQLAPRVVDDGKPDPLLRLAIRIAHNLALDELRRRRVSTPEMDPATEPPPPDPLLRKVIEACKALLKGKPGLALAARLGSDGESDEVLAARLRMQVNTFLQNFSRARKQLARCLEQKGVVLS